MRLESYVAQLDQHIAEAGGDENAKGEDGRYLIPEGADYGGLDGASRRAFRNYAIVEERLAGGHDPNDDASYGIYVLPHGPNVDRFQ